jgi:hypothetical protein
MEMKVSQYILWGDTDEDEEGLATSGKDQPNTIIKDCNENEITEEPSFKKQKNRTLKYIRHYISQGYQFKNLPFLHLCVD